MAWRRTWWVAIVGASVACGGKAEGTSFENKEQPCAQFCAASSSCEQTLDQELCEEQCVENEVISRNGQKVLTACLEEAQCFDGEGAGVAFIACLEDGLDDVETSETVEDFCTESLPALNECGGEETTPFDIGLCEDFLVLASDEFLTELNACSELECEDQQTCVGLEFADAVDLQSLQALGDTVDIEGLAGLLDLPGGALDGLGDLSNLEPPTGGEEPSEGEGPSGAAGAPN